MKNILSILLVSVLLFSCSKEDEIQDTILDSDLIGNWYHENGGSNSSNYCYDMTLSSNGKFVYQSERCYDEWNYLSNSGDWWVEGNHLVLSGSSWGLTSTYSLNGNLTFDDMEWSK